MKLEINISDGKLKHLSPQAKNEITKISLNRALDIIDEANRIEAVQRDSNNDPEITATHIKTADNYISRFGTFKKKGTPFPFLKLLLFISSTLAGGMFDNKKMDDIIYLLAFLSVFLLAIFSMFYLIFNTNGNE